MKRQIFRASSVLAVLAGLVAFSLSGSAQQPASRPQTIEQQEQQELQLPELLVQQVDAEALKMSVPQACKGMVPVVQTHDVADNFTTPGNPVALSPALATYLSGKPVKGYDDNRNNMYFADSFKLRNCRVCYATLEVRVRHQPGNWALNAPNYSNDSMLAGVAPFPGALRFIGPVSLWSAALPNPKTVTYATTAGGLSNLNGYLFGNTPAWMDLVAQDDTEFDYAKLSVWYY